MEEAFLVERFEDMNKFTTYASRVSIQKKGMDLAADMMGGKQKICL